ncbi:hypothetical protein GCM10025776_29520 [Corallincola platygyrae]
MNAAPTINSVQVEGDDIQQGVKITVMGSGFGEKDQAAPKLYDKTDLVYENGVPNDHYTSYANGADIVRDNVDPDALWTKSSEYNWDGVPPRIERSTARTEHLSAYYSMPGIKSYLGWPRAISGANTVRGARHFYISWWMRVKAHPQNYYQHVISPPEGGMFETGAPEDVGEEVLVIDTTGKKPDKTARLLHYEVIEDADGRREVVHIDIDDAKKTEDLGRLIQTIRPSGDQVTATILDQEKSYGSNKFIRVWDNPGGENLRISWTNDEMSGMGGRSYTDWIGVSGKWTHMEVWGNLDTRQLVALVDNEVNHDIQMIDVKEDPNFSANIGLIGFDGKVQYLQQTDVSEIYLDYTFQRIMIGDAPNWSEVKHAEIQLPTEWTPTNISFNLDQGSFEKVTGSLFVYVFDKGNLVNETGFKLCLDCKAKPSPVEFN